MRPQGSSKKVSLLDEGESSLKPARKERPTPFAMSHAEQQAFLAECILFLYHELGGSAVDSTTTTTITTANNAAVESSASPSESTTPPPSTKSHSNYRLIVASNRDEILSRSTEPMHFWKDPNNTCLAGRDVRAGGTWLGVTRCGKFATLTNIPSVWDELLVYMETKARSTVLTSIAVVAAAAMAVIVLQTRRQEVGGEWTAALLILLSAAVVTGSVGVALSLRGAARKSRGALVADFLNGDENSEQYCARQSKEMWQYAGCNLVVADSSGAWVLSNRDGAGTTRLPHGFYGLGNATLDTPWAKMTRGKSRVLKIIFNMAADPKFGEDDLVDLLMDALADETPCQPSSKEIVSSICVPPTVYVSELARIVRGWTRWGAESPTNKYATRTSTVVLLDASGRCKVVERNLEKDGDWTAQAMRNAKRETFAFDLR